jgi:hypothetical protein
VVLSAHKAPSTQATKASKDAKVATTTQIQSTSNSQYERKLRPGQSPSEGQPGHSNYMGEKIQSSKKTTKEMLKQIIMFNWAFGGLFTHSE